jgi:hypothetical protein
MISQRRPLAKDEVPQEQGQFNHAGPTVTKARPRCRTSMISLIFALALVAVAAIVLTQDYHRAQTNWMTPNDYL